MSQSMIFSQAINRVKKSQQTEIRPALSSVQPKKEKLLINQEKPILQRIKRNTDFTEDNIMKVSSKVIKKIDRNRDSWKHDKYTGGPQSIKFTVFLRNVPGRISLSTVQSLLAPADAALIIGIKVDGETAEVNFSRLDTAERASETLNGSIIKGQKIKAVLVSEANKFQNKLYEKSFEDFTIINSDNKLQSDLPPKGSIFDRIKRVY